MKFRSMKGGASRTNLVLLELILNLFLFLICAVVCVSLIFYARSLSEESTKLTEAVYLAQTAAETLKSGGELPTDYTDEISGLDVKIIDKNLTSDIEIYYNESLIYSVEGVHEFEKE